MMYVSAALIGLFSGIASGLFGVGGGIIMVPAMMFFMGLPIHVAVGTSLAVIIPTALMGTYKHNIQHNIDWFVALSLAPTAILGGFLGAHLTTLISGPSLKRAFGGVLLAVGIKLLFFK
jgi:uncharacterized membrane protein YfcA